MSKWFDDMQKELNKNKIDYPQDFIDKCLIIFPNDEVIKTLLDDKSFLLGEELQKRSKQVISEQELREASENSNMEEVVKKAKTVEGAKELLANFIDLYDKQYLSKGYLIKDGLVVYSESILFDNKIKNGEIKAEAIQIDPVARREMEEAVYFRLKQNEIRRRKGLKLAKKNLGR